MWTNGRQEGNYQKKKMFSKIASILGFDCWLIRVREGTRIPAHIDPVKDGYIHRRALIQLSRRPRDGGNLFIRNRVKFIDVINPRRFRVTVFSPSEQMHWMDAPSEDLLFLSFGWLKKA